MNDAEAYRVVPVAECAGIHPSNRVGRTGFVCQRRGGWSGPEWTYSGSPTFDQPEEAQGWIDGHLVPYMTVAQPGLPI